MIDSKSALLKGEDVPDVISKQIFFYEFGYKNDVSFKGELFEGLISIDNEKFTIEHEIYQNDKLMEKFGPPEDKEKEIDDLFTEAVIEESESESSSEEEPK